MDQLGEQFQSFWNSSGCQIGIAKKRNATFLQLPFDEYKLLRKPRRSAYLLEGLLARTSSRGHGGHKRGLLSRACTGVVAGTLGNPTRATMMSRSRCLNTHTTDYALKPGHRQLAAASLIVRVRETKVVLRRWPGRAPCAKRPTEALEFCGTPALLTSDHGSLPPSFTFSVSLFLCITERS